MAHTQQMKIAKFVKPCPCAICKSADNVHEYMLRNDYSFFYCDTCKIGASAGPNAEVAVRNWDIIMRKSGDKDFKDFFEWLDEHVHIQDSLNAIDRERYDRERYDEI